MLYSCAIIFYDIAIIKKIDYTKTKVPIKIREFNSTTLKANSAIHVKQ